MLVEAKLSEDYRLIVYFLRVAFRECLFGRGNVLGRMEINGVDKSKVIADDY